MPAGELGRGGGSGRFPPHFCMVALGVSHRGVAPPYFCPCGLEIDGPAYENMAENAYAPFTQSTYGSDCSAFQQDGAPSHTAQNTAKKLAEIFGKNRIAQNPPNSPDLSVLDYHIWDCVDKKAQSMQPRDTAELKKSIASARNGLDMGEARKAIESWPKLLQKRIDAGGARFGHSL